MGSEVYPDVGMTNVMVWNSAHELLLVNRLNAAHVAMVARCFDQPLFTRSLRLATIPSRRYTHTMTMKTTQQSIIAAARRIVQRDGVAHLTIEAVAREAGFSKGGVLYHFPTKETLIEGMIHSFLEEFEHDLASALVQEKVPGRWLRAYR